MKFRFYYILLVYFHIFDILGHQGKGGASNAGPPESQAGGTEGGKPKALSQPVNPGGVGGFPPR